MENDEKEIFNDSSPEALFESLTQATNMRPGRVFMMPIGSISGASAMMPQAKTDKPPEDSQAVCASAMKPTNPFGK